MFRNYIKVALRSLSRQKGYAFINVTGLAIGLAAFALIMMYVHFHWSYDRFNQDTDRLYRMVEIQQWGPEDVHVAVTMGALAPALMEDFPEIEAATRVRRISDRLFQVNDIREYESVIYVADDQFFNIFSFPLIHGTTENLLAEPSQIVLTEKLAMKYFGRTDVIGETILVQNKSELRVAAVMADPPSNSHIRPDCIIAWQEFVKDSPNLESWWTNHLATYFKLIPGADIESVNAKLPDFIAKYRVSEDPDYKESMKMYAQPMLDMHLHTTHIKYDTNPDKTDANVLTMLVAIAVGIILLACINFMNLATARSMRRAREVGLRKVVGAMRIQLMLQYIGESMLLSLLALLPAFVLVELAGPHMGTLLGREDINFHLFNNPWMSGGMLATALVVGILSGVYPAFVLSAYRPVRVLKGRVDSLRKGAFLRRALVVMQFSLSILLLIGTGIIIQQIHYLRNKPLGYDKNMVVVIPIGSEQIRERLDALTTELKLDPSIENVSLSNSIPSSGRSSSGMRPADTPEDRDYVINVNYVDENFVPVYGMEMAMGRNFNADLASDSMGMIINETAYRQFGWDTIDGKYIRFINDEKRPVVGVVKDYHFRQLSIQIEPLVLMFYPTSIWAANVKLVDGNVPATLDRIRKIWDGLYPEYPFEYSFFDERIERQFEEYKRAQGILLIFSSIAILIASLGLLGLASFMANRRTREFSIRKVLGASPITLISLISREFVILLSIASLIAWGTAYLIAEKLLAHMPYHAPLHWSIFIEGALLAMVFAMLTVSGQAARAASVNPADALRHE